MAGAEGAARGGGGHGPNGQCAAVRGVWRRVRGDQVQPASHRFATWHSSTGSCVPPTGSAPTHFFAFHFSVDLAIQKPSPLHPTLRPVDLYIGPLVQCMEAATLGMSLEAGPTLVPVKLNFVTA